MSRAPLPEARGSHVAAVIEINRAVAYSAKAASRERRRAKKIAKAKRKAEEHRREVMQQQELPVQQPKKKRHVTPGKPLPEREAAIIRDAIVAHGKDAIAAVLSECTPHTNEGGIRSAIDKLLRPEASNDRHCPSRLSALMLLSSRIQRGQWARESPATDATDVPARMVEPHSAEDDPRFVRIHDEVEGLKEEMARLNESLRLLVGKPAAPATPSPRDELNRFMRSRFTSEDELEINYSLLYSEAQLRSGKPWSKLAAQVGITDFSPGSGWRLNVADELGLTSALRDLAYQLFGKGAR